MDLGEPEIYEVGKLFIIKKVNVLDKNCRETNELD